MFYSCDEIILVSFVISKFASSLQSNRIGSLFRVKKDAVDLEEQISKAEAEKTSRDHAMRSLNDDIAGLDELISKLNKEKKFFQVHIN